MTGDEGQQDKYEKVIESVKMLSVNLSFQNNKLLLVASNKCYDSFEYISIMILQ